METFTALSNLSQGEFVLERNQFVMGFIGIPVVGRGSDYYDFTEKDRYVVSDRWLTGYTKDGDQHWVGTASNEYAIAAPGIGIAGYDKKGSSVNAGGEGVVAETFFDVDATGLYTRWDAPEDERLFPKHLLGDMTTEFSSCAETVEALPVDEYKRNYEVVSTEEPDFGPDGLACTDDDVHGWVIHSRLTEKSFSEDYDPRAGMAARGKLDPGNNGEPNRTQFTPRFKISVPSYATSKDQVTVSSTITPAFAETFGGDPKNHASNNTSVVTVPIKQVQSVIQAKAKLNTLEFSGTDIGWTMRFGNTTSGDVGNSVFYDVLPYNGDERGSHMNTPLTNVRIEASDTNQADAHIFVTTDDPATVNADPASANWVEYGQHSGQITAIKFVNDSLEPDEFMNFTVKASTQGMGDGSEMFNNLLAGHADGFSLPVPAVAPVRTEVYDTGISGTLWRDRNENGVIDEDETVRFSGVTLTLTNSEGEAVETTTTDEQGQYHFTHKVDGDYTITVTDKSGIPTTFHYTTVEKRQAHVDSDNRHSIGNDFGFNGFIPAHLKIAKTADVSGPVAYGTTANFTYTVLNDAPKGAENAVIKDVTDDKGVKVSCPSDTLAPGESVQCTGSGVIK